MFTATAVSDHKAPSLENILLLSIQRVLSNSGTAGTISGQVGFKFTHYLKLHSVDILISENH